MVPFTALYYQELIHMTSTGHFSLTFTSTTTMAVINSDPKVFDDHASILTTCGPRHARIYFKHVLTKEFGRECTQKGLYSTVARVDDTAFRSNDGCEDKPFLDTFHAMTNTE